MAWLVRSTTMRLALVVMAFAAGCRREASPDRTSVQGRVSFQGQPVAGGTIVFTPDRDRGGHGRPIPAEIGPDGRFQLADAPGGSIPPGWYRVAIAPAPASSASPPDRQAIFPAQLGRPDRSGLIREVVSGQENIFDFAIETQ